MWFPPKIYQSHVCDGIYTKNCIFSHIYIYAAYMPNEATLFPVAHRDRLHWLKAFFKKNTQVAVGNLQDASENGHTTKNGGCQTPKFITPRLLFFLLGGIHFEFDIPSRKLTCPLKRDQFNRKYIFQPLIFRGYVSCRGCICWLAFFIMGCSSFP